MRRVLVWCVSVTLAAGVLAAASHDPRAGSSPTSVAADGAGTTASSTTTSTTSTSTTTAPSTSTTAPAPAVASVAPAPPTTAAPPRVARAATPTTTKPAPTSKPTPPTSTAGAYRVTPDCHGMYVLDLATGRATRVSDSPRGAFGPRWASDGVSLVWAEGQSRVLFARADGVVRTAAASGANNTPTWAADSRRIIWSRFAHSAGFEVVVTDTETASETVLPTQRANSILAASPSGEQIAYGWSTQGEPLRVIRIDGTADTVVPDSTAHRTPAWSPDNRTLAYTGASFSGIAAFDVATGTTRLLYSGTPTGSFGFAGPDRLLVTTDAGIDVVDLATGATTATIKDGIEPVWDAARNVVIFRRMTTSPYFNTLEARLDGTGERTLLVDDDAQVLDVDPSPIGERLAFHCSALNSA